MLVRLYSAYIVADFPLAHGVGLDRHLRVKCPCGRDEEFDAIPLLQKKLGGRRIREVEARLVCVCGRKEAKLDIYKGPPSRVAELPEIYRM